MMFFSTCTCCLLGRKSWWNWLTPRYFRHYTNSSTQMAGNNLTTEKQSIMSPGHCWQRSECRAAAGLMQKHNNFGRLLTHPFNIQKTTYVPVPRRLWMGQGSLLLYLWNVWQWLIPNSPDEAPLWICGPDLYSVEAWNELFASWLRLLKCNTSTDHLKNWLQTPNWMHVHWVCNLLEEYCWAENVPTLRRKLSN